MSSDQTDLYGGTQPEKGDWLGEVRTGQNLRGIFAVTSVGTRPMKSGGSFLTLSISDRSGHMDGVGWGHAHLAPQLSVGTVVQLSGTVDEYQGKPQIKISELAPVTSPMPPSYFLPEGPQDRDILAERLKKVRAGITTPYLTELLDRLFEGEGLLDAYLTAPAAKLRHQAYVGGLAEHSLNMAEHARWCGDFYPELDADLLVAAALLHDIGKIQEYRMDTVIDYTESGRMEGHIVLGDRLVRRVSDAIASFPEGKRRHLSHLILSHQGRLEYASPVTPKSLEATVLYALDLLDSRVATWRDIRVRTGGGRRWSEYDRLDQQFWFLGEEDGSQD